MEGKPFPEQATHLDQSQGLDVQALIRYVRVLNAYKWGIFGLAISIAILTWLITLRMTPIYSVQSTIVIESSRADVVPIQELIGLGDSRRRDYLETQMAILRSRSLGMETVKQLNLLENPSFNQGLDEFDFGWRTTFPFSLVFPEYANLVPTEQMKLQRAATRLLQSMQVYSIPQTKLIIIRVESPDPELAAQIANTHAQVFIKSNLDARAEVSSQASAWLGDRLSALLDDLRASEKLLQDFKETEGLAGSNGGMTLANMELETVSGNRIVARDRRLELENLYNQVQSIDISDPSQIDLIPAVLKSSIASGSHGTVLGLQRRKAELSKRYGYRHPRMIAINDELEEATAAYKNQVQSIINGLENDLKVARASERSLESSLDSARADFQNLNRKESRFRELEQEVETRRNLYNTFLTRFNETNATADLTTTNARITDPAVPAIYASKPNKVFIVQVAFLVSLMIGMAIALLLEFFNNTIKTPDDIETKLGRSVLGILPTVDLKSESLKDVYQYYVDKGKSNYAEAVRSIRTSLILSSLDTNQKVIAVTSSVPGEGKTSTSLSLAFAFGSMEKVLLIDADMRRPSIGKVLGSSSVNRPGLSSVVAGTASVSEAVFDFADGNVKVMTSGPIPPNPLELLGSKRFETLLRELSTHFDRIIIDTAPSGAVSDALALSRQVDAMVYVVKADSTTSKLASNTLKRLDKVHANIAGVVLNQVNIHKNPGYEDYYSGYYNYYGYGTES